MVTTAVYAKAVPTGPPPRGAAIRARAAIDRLLSGAVWAAAVLTFCVLVGILASLLIGACPVIARFQLAFFTTSVWDPVSRRFGDAVMFYGTLATSLIALVIAVPVSFGSALLLTELSHRHRPVVAGCSS